MRYSLDTNVIIGLLDGNRALLNQVRRRGQQELCTSSVVVHELYFGAYRSQRMASNVALLDALRFETLALDRDDAREAGEVRAALAALGTPIGPMDTLIAGQARARAMVLVTRNVREFSRVPGLQVENWEA